MKRRIDLDAERSSSCREGGRGPRLEDMTRTTSTSERVLAGETRRHVAVTRAAEAFPQQEYFTVHTPLGPRPRPLGQAFHGLARTWA